VSLQIDYLADHPELLAVVAEWHYREWSHLSSDASADACAERLRGEARRGGIPTLFLALAAGAPIGTASLRAHDMDGRDDLSPWLAGVYVCPPNRRSGVGAALVRRVASEAAALGVPILYLYTTSQQNEAFYSHLGWSVRERVEYHGVRRVIMSIAP